MEQLISGAFNDIYDTLVGVVLAEADWQQGVREAHVCL